MSVVDESPIAANGLPHFSIDALSDCCCLVECEEW